MDCWESTPRLAFMSPEPESGKTRALEVTSLFVPNPRLSFNMSAAALVRIIAKGHETGAVPTILYDEIDNLFSKSEEGISDLRGALNSGYRRNAVSTRCVNKGEGIADFVCYAPLALAGLKTFQTRWQPGRSSFTCGPGPPMSERRASGLDITPQRRSRSRMP